MALAVAVVVAFALPLPWVYRMEREIQVNIEDRVRTAAAASLAAIVPPGEGTVSESAGYIGYPSRVTLWDYPGLTSRTSLAAIRQLAPADRTMSAMIDELKPRWLVLRPGELNDLRARFPATAALYREVERFGSPVDRIDVLGYRKTTVDGEFMILRRSP
jgi:hypothetical protein